MASPLQWNRTAIRCIAHPMTDSSLHDRLRDLYDKMREFPEASRCEHGTHLKPEAFVAFLELRQLIEREVLPKLYQLERRAEPADPPSSTWQR